MTLLTVDQYAYHDYVHLTSSNVLVRLICVFQKPTDPQINIAICYTQASERKKTTAMPYSRTEFKFVKPDQVNHVLIILTQECFVCGQAAYRLDDGAFAIDAGENDVRAIYDESNSAINFFCRYKWDMSFYDQKFQAFATKYGIDTTLAN